MPEFGISARLRWANVGLTPFGRSPLMGRVKDCIP